MIFLVGIFLILHGLVHLIYAGHSLGNYEMAPGLTMPRDSWVFSKLLSQRALQVVTAAVLGAVTLAFVAAGVGLFLRLPWWRELTVITAIASSIVFFLVWDGKFKRLPDKGFVGIGLNIVLLVLVLVFELPVLG